MSYIFSGFQPSSSKMQVPADRKQFALSHIHFNNQAIVTKVIQPNKKGRVSFRATTWFGVCLQQLILLPNAEVRVTGFYNATTLIVEPISDASVQVQFPELIDVA